MTVTGLKASAAAGPLEFRLQIVVEVGTPAQGGASPGGAANAEESAPGASCLPRLFEAARSLLGDLSQGLDVRIATLAWPSGVRVIAQGVAGPDDLAGIRAAAAALGEKSFSRSL
jgi:hypothetical protein